MSGREKKKIHFVYIELTVLAALVIFGLVQLLAPFFG